MKTLILKKTGYIVKGISDLTPWGGGNACIEMEPFAIKTINTKTLLANINGAICDIYENYEGTLKFYKTVTVGKVSETTREYACLR